jgi:hypothetical protein
VCLAFVGLLLDDDVARPTVTGARLDRAVHGRVEPAPAPGRALVHVGILREAAVEVAARTGGACVVFRMLR